MKNALILGGSYFIGRVFVEELLEAGGYAVHVLNRGNIPMRKEGVVELRCDRRDQGGMKGTIPNFHWDAVVDFCAFTPGDVEIALSAICAGRPPGQYIFISTASVYAKTNALPVVEDSPKLAGPQPELGPFAGYGFDKWRSELALERECAERGVPFTILRPAFVYGKYNYAPRESYFFDLILKGETVTLPEERLALFSFVSVWDLAGAIVRCMGNDAVYGKAFNVSAGEMISYDRLVEVLETVTGKKAGTARASVEEIDRKGIPLPFPLDEHLVYSGERLRSALGFRYTPFLEGMRETYRYYLLGKGKR